MKPVVRFRELLPHVVIDVNGCWNWTAATTSGYALLGRSRGPRGQATTYNYRVHRLTYELVRGPIPDGLQLDHLCRNRRCVNPWHLEAVTAQENLARSPISIMVRRRALTHCKFGHEYTEANTYFRPTGGRVCRACDTKAGRANRQLAKAGV